MPLSPRVLLSIDYEPWFAIFRRYDTITSAIQRKKLDDGFALDALDPVLEQLRDVTVSVYLVGEIVQWYPQIPQKIVAAGHELGLHCQIHRPLIDVNELSADLRSSAAWRREYRVRGYRAPMVGISESAYELLGENGFYYSSSIYAPAGTLLKKNKIWELPVSTLKVFGKSGQYTAPRDFSLGLLINGEFPYGSSFTIGMAGKRVLKIIEDQLKAGLSPVVIMHPYELMSSSKWFSRVWWDIVLHPTLLPFTWNKTGFLASLLRHFPVSSLGGYLDETLEGCGTLS
jgi:hypothetical protein